jgi:hypothetical protein
MLVLVPVAFTILIAGTARAQGPQSAEQQLLAAEYSPVLSLDPQRDPCGSGEAYRP